MNRSLIATTAIAPAIWGTTYLVTTELLPPGRPLLAATIRALPSGLALIAWLAVRTGRAALPHGQWWWRAAILAVLNIGAFQALLFISAYRLPGGIAAVVGALGPFVAAGFAYPLLRLAPAGRTFLAGALGLVGVTLVVLRATARLDTVGLVAGVTGTVIMALGTVLGRRWGTPPAGLLAITGWQLAIGGALLLPVTLATEGLPAHLTGRNLAGYAYLTVFGAMVAYALWFRGVTRLQPAQASMLTMLSPVMATALGWLVLGQSLTPLQLLGAAVTILAIVLGATAVATPRAAAAPTPKVPVAA